MSEAENNLDRAKDEMQAAVEAVLALLNSESVDSRERIRAAADRLASGEVLVVVCGEFSKGKSSLINNILGEWDLQASNQLFPIDIDQTTSIVSTIRWGEREVIRVRHLDESGPEPQIVEREISRSDLRDLVTEAGNPHNERNVVSVQIEAPLPVLDAGLVLVDTPGIGGASPEHAETTLGFLPEADAVVYVLDHFDGATDSELEFIEVTHKYAHAVVYVLTHADKKDEAGLALTENATRSKLASRLGASEESFVIVSVSNTERRFELERNLPAEHWTSNFAELEDAIWTTFVERRGAMLLAAVADECETALRAEAAPRLVELESLESRIAEDTSAHDERLAELTEQLTALNDTTGVRTQLREAVAAAFKGAHDTVRDEARELRHAVTDGRYTDAFGKNGDTGASARDAVLKALVQDFHDLRVRALAELDGRLAWAAETAQSASGVDLALSSFGDAAAWSERKIDGANIRGRMDVKERVREVAKQTGSRTIITGGGSITAYVLAGTPGGPAGMAIGAVAGVAATAFQWFTSWRGIGEREVERMRAEMKRELDRYLSENDQRLRTALTEAQTKFGRELVDDFDQKVRVAQDSLRSARRAAVSAGQASAGEAGGKAEPLRQELREIARLQQRVRSLTSAPDASGTTTTSSSAPANDTGVGDLSASTDSDRVAGWD